LIIETILSSIDENGKVNFAPVGVHIPDNTLRISEVQELKFFLYSGSKTLANLKTIPEGVINFTEDILNFVNTALFSESLPALPSSQVRPPRMSSAKTVWEFAVTHFDDSSEPAKLTGRVLCFEEYEQSGFCGFCRSTGVILEALILATCLQWVPFSKIKEAWPLWREVVAKTGGTREKEAFQTITAYFIEKGISIPGS